jgi:hypothetical protein
MDMPARVTKRADPPTAATCGFFEDEAALRQPSSSCDSRCAFVDDQVAFMPRGLASCYFRLTKHTAGLPPNVSASTGQPRVLLAGPSWGAAVPGSGCGQRCGFPNSWGEARFTQPLLDAQCPLELRPIGATLLRSSGATFSHRGAADAHPTRDPYLFMLRRPEQWAQTQSEWRIGARARSLDRVAC